MNYGFMDSPYHITGTHVICCFEEMPYMTWDLEDPNFLTHIHNVSSHCMTAMQIEIEWRNGIVWHWDQINKGTFITYVHQFDDTMKAKDMLKHLQYTNQQPFQFVCIPCRWTSECVFENKNLKMEYTRLVSLDFIRGTVSITNFPL